MPNIILWVMKITNAKNRAKKYEKIPVEEEVYYHFRGSVFVER